ITPDAAAGIGGWRDDELAKFLATGHAAGRGTASGPMGEAVDLSLSHLAPEDISAIVAYVRTVAPLASPDLPAPRAEPAPESHKAGPADAGGMGKAVFAGACIGCHAWSGEGTIASYATLTGGRAVNDPSGRNVVQAIVGGVNRRGGSGSRDMPAFGRGYSDREIAAVANYVTERFGARPASLTAADVASIRGEAAH
ncbi:MAG: cytochrome c, partial [Actinomycetospora chiangmaiensis]|nr:cytochrome c [Actinomycetospora chiangmaiensis]